MDAVLNHQYLTYSRSSPRTQCGDATNERKSGNIDTNTVMEVSGQLNCELRPTTRSTGMRVT